MFCDQLHEPVVDFAPHFVGGDSAKSACWNLDAEIEQSFMADIYDYRLRSTRARQEMCNFLDRLLRRRQSDPNRCALRENREPLQGQGEMNATLVIRHRMNFIDNDRLNISQDAATPFGRQEEVERFGSRDPVSYTHLRAHET